MRYPSMIVESPSSRVVQMLARGTHLAGSPPFDHLGAGGLQSFSPDSAGRLVWLRPTTFKMPRSQGTEPSPARRG